MPAASTLKGLCAHALWHAGGQKDSPVDLLRSLNDAIKLATSRCDGPVTVTSCTVSQLTGGSGKSTNALLRQFAHTTAIDCLVTCADADLAERLAEALKCAPLYLGDSESLMTITHVAQSTTDTGSVRVGDNVNGINTVFPFTVVEAGTISCGEDRKPVVLYMQDDPISPTAELKRCIAPLSAQGDDYLPLAEFSFKAAQEGELVAGVRLRGIVTRTEDKPADQAATTKTRIRKKS